MAFQEIGDEFALSIGLEADRPAPQEGIIYLSKDTKTPWICYNESDGWELLSPIKVNENGNVLFNGRFMFAEIALSTVFVKNTGTASGANYTVNLSGFPSVGKPYLLEGKVTSTTSTIEWIINDVLIHKSNRVGTNQHTFPQIRISEPITSFKLVCNPSNHTYQSVDFCINPLPLLLVDEE